MVLLDEPSMGLAPQIVEEVFEIVKDLQHQGEGHLPAGRAEHQHRRCATPTTATSWKQPHRDGRRGQACARNEDVKEFYLGMGGGDRKSFRDVKSYKRRKRWLA